MKKNLKNHNYKHVSILLSLFFMLITVANAQSHKEEVDYIQSIFGMEKKAAIANFLQIEYDNDFWTIYDLYETERKELGKKRLDLLQNYAKHYGNLDDEVTDYIIKEIQLQKKSMDKLIDKYYKQVKKSSGSKVSAQFYQFENYILSAIRLKVLQSIPFIGESE